MWYSFKIKYFMCVCVPCIWFPGPGVFAISKVLFHWSVYVLTRVLWRYTRVYSGNNVNNPQFSCDSVTDLKWFCNGVVGKCTKSIEDKTTSATQNIRVYRELLQQSVRFTLVRGNCKTFRKLEKIGTYAEHVRSINQQLIENILKF